MGDRYDRYKGDWIGSFRCDFPPRGKPVWKYCREDRASAVAIEGEERRGSTEWTARGSTALNEDNARRIDLLERAQAIGKLPNFSEFLERFVGEDGNCIYESAADVFGFVPSVADPVTPISDDGISILLNHVVSAQSTEPLTTVISTLENRRMLEVRGLPIGQPSWFYSPRIGERGAVAHWKQCLGTYMMGFPELFFACAGDTPTIAEFSEIEDVLRAHRQKTTISVLRFEVNKDSCALQLRFDCLLCAYRRAAKCGCLPIPGSTKLSMTDRDLEPIVVNAPEVVITSPVVERALTDLSDVWQDKATAVLISAPPGSGKENFALSIPYGSGRKGDTVPAISLADGTPERQEKLILGYQQEDGTIVDGMLARAKDFSVFVDEAHYPDDGPGLRAKLLRALEAREYYPVGSTQPRAVENVQWVFASSRPLDGGEKSLATSEPNDFWTRMSHLVRIEHPFQVSGGHQDMLKDYFRFFWWDRVGSHFGIDPARVPSRRRRPRDLRDDGIADQLNQGFVLAMLEDEPLDELAEAFSRELIKTIGTESLQEVSIRGLRSMVSRIFSRCVGAVTSNSKDAWGAVFGVSPARASDEVRGYMRKTILDTQQIAKLRV